MEPSCKRQRGSNYTPDEKNCLLNIISQYKRVIENKKTDAVTWKEKEATWQKVAANFNSLGKYTFRSVESLRKCYDNLKKDIRKDVAAKKMEIMKTGGGVPVKLINHDGNEELLLSIINDKSVLGLNNFYDSDQTQSGSTEVVTQVAQGVQLDSQQGVGEVLPLNEAIHVDDTCQIEDINWGDVKVRYLRTPVNKKLRQEPSASTSNTARTRRRRPIATSLTAANLADEYHALAKVKMENELIKQEILKHDLKRKEREDEELMLKIELLKVELQIKKQALISVESST